MLEFLHVMYNTIWSNNWLSLLPNVIWAYGTSNTKPGITFTKLSDLFLPIPLAVLFLFIRYSLQKYWFTPLGIHLGIKPLKVKRCDDNARLEQAFSEGNEQDLSYKTLQKLARELSFSERKVLRWFRIRKMQDKTCKLTKFCETSWRFTYYLISFCYGLGILWTKPWFWDINKCWDKYLHQSVPLDIWWYYMMNLSFYYTLIVSQFRDVKRKDFWEMFVHHLVTVLLISVSWLCMLTRMGSLILVLHDCADIFLELAKSCKYAGKETISDLLFVIFTITWVVTRNGIYPLFVYNVAVVAPQLVDEFRGYYIVCTLLILLFALHVFWTYLILKVACRMKTAGTVARDIRSSCSENFTASSSHSHSE